MRRAESGVRSAESGERRAMPKLLEIRSIAWSRLRKHPDAEAFGADAEDRAALTGSVAECGLLDPLSVVDGPLEGGEKTWLVIDGCGRLDALSGRGSGLPVPCMVFDLGDFSVREFALHRNTMQRKVTTGQRVLCYMATMGADGAAPGKTPGAGVSHDTRDDSLRVSRDTRREISETLGCSPVDVAAARELLEEAGKEDASEVAREVYEDVLAGRTPIRRWKAALAGREATRDKPKKPVDFRALAERSITSLGTVAEAWPTLRGAVKDEIYERFAALWAALPEELRAVAAR